MYTARVDSCFSCPHLCVHSSCIGATPSFDRTYKGCDLSLSALRAGGCFPVPPSHRRFPVQTPPRAFRSCALACLNEGQRPTSHPCIGATPGVDRTNAWCDLPLSAFQAGRALSGATVPLALSGAVPSGSLPREGTRTLCALRCLPLGTHRHEDYVAMSRESFPSREKGTSRRASRAVQLQARDLLGLGCCCLRRTLESLVKA